MAKIEPTVSEGCEIEYRGKLKLLAVFGILNLYHFQGIEQYF